MIEQTLIEQAKEAMIKAESEKALELCRGAIDAGVDPLELISLAFIPGIKAVGDLFGKGQLFLPELIKSAGAMTAVTQLIDDALNARGVQQKQKSTVLIATVKGDVHDIGKCIVVSLMKANGFTVYDLGRDVDTDRIIEEAVKVNADVIGTSALLTTTMPRQKDLEDALKSSGLKSRFKTVVGGAPVTPRWAARIGADAYAEDAQDGILKIQQLLVQN